MQVKMTIIEKARKIIDIETSALQKLSRNLDDNFYAGYNLLKNCSGKVVVCGVGKSAAIGKKVVATFNSTGTHSVFLHAADAVHGDLGILGNQDVVLCISNSGESAELKVLVRFFVKHEIKILAITSNQNSFLAQQSNCFILTPKVQEADPNNLAPTASSITQLALGDALAICLMENKGFGALDFAKIHPGGALGSRLNLTIADLVQQKDIPQVMENDPVSKVIVEISSKRLGATAVLNQDQQLVGIITDGDIRRMLSKYADPLELVAKIIMTSQPQTINNQELAVEGLNRMRGKKITQLLVVDNDRQYIGVIHIHDLLKAGIY